MGFWLLRGTGMALLVAGSDVGLAWLAAREATALDLLRGLGLALVVCVALLWGLLDSWRRIELRGRNWLIASLVAGLLSGALRVIGRAIFVDGTGPGALATALTGDAAFAALVILLPASVGLLAGGQIRPRQSGARATRAAKPVPQG
jgi:hypothetical protein